MNLFEAANQLKAAKPSRITSVPKKAREGVIRKRDGIVVTDTIKRVLPSLPVAKKSERIDRSMLSAECIDDWLNPVSRRKALGKFVYERREELIVVLVKGYMVNPKTIRLLSLIQLEEVLDSEKVKQNRLLESRKKVENDTKERLGAFYNSFVIVSDIVSVHNTEHYKLAVYEKDEDEPFAAIPLSKEELAKRKRESDARWMVRKAILDAKLAEERFCEIACSNMCLSYQDILDIMDGKSVEYVSIEQVAERKKAVEKAEMIAKRGKRKDIRLRELSKGGFLDSLTK